MNKRIKKKRERLKAQYVRSYHQLKEMQRAQHESKVRCRQVGYRTASVENCWAKTLQFKRRISLRQEARLRYAVQIAVVILAHYTHMILVLTAERE